VEVAIYPDVFSPVFRLANTGSKQHDSAIEAYADRFRRPLAANVLGQGMRPILLGLYVLETADKVGVTMVFVLDVGFKYP
jgi:hypothetical protein